MKEWGQYSAIIRIMAADKQAGNRSKVNAVIVVMTSTFQKKTAVSNLKGLLKTANAKGNLRGITIKDCFGTHAQPRARALTRYAGHLREQQDISGYRVINKQGEAFLQTYQGNSDWQDVNISDMDLVPFYMTREEREKGSAMELEGVANPTAHSPPLQQQPNFAPLQHQFTHLQQQHSMPQHQARGNLMNRGVQLKSGGHIGEQPQLQPTAVPPATTPTAEAVPYPRQQHTTGLPPPTSTRVTGGRRRGRGGSSTGRGAWMRSPTRRRRGAMSAVSRETSAAPLSILQRLQQSRKQKQCLLHTAPG
jgi:alkylated DNA nucleotide flippase Atl1